MKLTIRTREEADRVVGLINDLNLHRAWTVEIKTYKPERTIYQLRYYWGVQVKALADVTGAEKEEMHEFISGEYFGWQEQVIFGQVKKKPIRTLSSPDLLSRQEMSNLFDWVIAFAAKHDIIIPYPKEEWE